MRALRQSTSVDLPVGPFVDSVDGHTPETALSITQPDVRLKKIGGAWAQKNAAQTLAHEENGFYEVTLDATDSNTLGCMELAIAKAGALIVYHEFMVITPNAWDALHAASGVGIRADLQGIAGVAGDAVLQGKAANVLYAGTVTGATTTTTLIDSALTQGAADFWKGRVVIFLTGSLRYQATKITAFDPATDKLTFDALTAAPSGGDTYLVF